MNPLEELQAELSAARNVARIAKTVLQSERNRNRNEMTQMMKKQKKDQQRIVALEAKVAEINDDATIMFATIQAQDQKIELRDAQISYLMTLVDCMGEELEKRDIYIPYEVMVQRVYEKREDLKEKLKGEEGHV